MDLSPLLPDADPARSFRTTLAVFVSIRDAASRYADSS